MLKKLAALFMSLMICLSLLPGQARANELPENNDPPAQVEIQDSETSDEPEPPVMPASAEELPEKEKTEQQGGN